MATRALPLQAPDVHGLEDEYFLVARYWMARNDQPAAFALLQATAKSAQATDKFALYTAIRAYQATRLHQSGDGLAALAWLNAVLEFAEAQAFVGTFRD